MTQYANHYGYTDVNPFEVVRAISEKTVEIRAMNAERDDSGSSNSTLGASAHTAQTSAIKSGSLHQMRPHQ
jgi:hypothetical protein